MAFDTGITVDIEKEHNPLKRYLVFFGDYYYPRGGINDMEGDFYTLEAAQKKAKELFEKEVADNYEGYNPDKECWCYIYDTHTRTKTEITWHS